MSYECKCGLVAAAGTPKEIAYVLAGVVKKATENEDFKKKMELQY